MAETTTNYAPKSSDEKLQEVWKRLQKHRDSKESATIPVSSGSSSVNSLGKREWPSYDTVLAGIIAADYNQTLKCPFDFLQRQDGQKTISPNGVVCCARLELFGSPSSNPQSSHHYTGILEPGSTWNHCLLRLSSAMQPPNQALAGPLAKSLLYATGDKNCNAQLFPISALKVFLSDTTDSTTNNTETAIPSRNILFGGSKIGQRETDYFAHCQCTSMTERMPVAVKPFVRKFWEYSDWPLSLGVSDFCRTVETTTSDPNDKEEVEKRSEGRQQGNNDNNDTPLNFPFAVIIKPCIQTEARNDDGDQKESLDAGDSGDEQEEADDENNNNASAPAQKSRWSRWSSSLSSLASRRTSSNVSSDDEPSAPTSFDSFLDFCLNQIPPETHLYDVFVCPTPMAVVDASQLQRIGRIVTTTPFMQSPADDGLFFKHQAKEEDYQLRPGWPEALQTQVSLDDGKVKGTIGTLAGWKLFEQLIAQGQFMDLEMDTES